MAVEIGPVQGTIRLNDQFTSGMQNAAAAMNRLAVGAVNLSAYMGIFNQVTGYVQKAAGAIIGLAMDAAREEAAILRINAALASTGGAVGLASEEIREIAERLSNVTGAEAEAAFGAAQMLLRFESIKGARFGEVMEVAAKAALLTGQDMQSAALAIGRAFEYPANSALMLRRVGLDLPPVIRQQIAALVDAGKTAEAQTVLYEALAAKVEAVAVVMGGSFTVQSGRAEGVVHKLREEIGGIFLPALTAANKSLADAAGGFNLLRLACQGLSVGITTLVAGLATAAYWGYRLAAALYSLTGAKATAQGLDDAAKGAQILADNMMRAAGATYYEMESGKRLTDLLTEQLAGARKGDTKGTEEQNKALAGFDAKLRETVRSLLEAATATGQHYEAARAGSSALADATIKTSAHAKVLELQRAALDANKTVSAEFWTWLEKMIASQSRGEAAARTRAAAVDAEAEATKRAAEAERERDQNFGKLLSDLRRQAEQATALADATARQETGTKSMTTAQEIFNRTLAQAADFGIAPFSKLWVVLMDLNREIVVGGKNTAILADQNRRLAAAASLVSKPVREIGESFDLQVKGIEAAVADQADLLVSIRQYGSEITAIRDKWGLLRKHTTDVGLQQRALIESRRQENIDAGITYDMILAILRAEQERVYTAAEIAAKIEEQNGKLSTQLSHWASALSLISQSAGGMDSLFGRVASALGNMMSGLETAFNKSKDTREQMEGWAAAINAAAQIAKELKIGGAGNQGGTSSFGGRMASNYASEGSMIGAVLGAIIGTMAYGQTAAGAALGSAIGGLIGSLITKAGDSASASLRMGGFIDVGETSDRLNGGIRDALTKVWQGVNLELASLGQWLTGLPLIDIKVRDNIVRVVVGNIVRTFSSMQDAINFAITEAVKQATSFGGHLPPEVLTVLKNTTASDLAALQSDIDFAKSIAYYGLPEVVRAIDDAVAEFFVNMQRAASLGLDTTKIVKMFADEIQRQKDSILGIDKTLTPEQRLRRDAEAFNQRMTLLKAEMQLQLAELQLKKADIEGRIAYLRAEAGITEGGLRLDRARIEGDAAVFQSEALLLGELLKALDAVNLAITVTEGVIAGIILITEQEIQAALKRIRAGTGGGRQQALQDFQDWLDDVRARSLGPYTAAMRDLKKEFDEQREKIKHNAAAVAALNEEYRRQTELLRAQQRAEIRRDVLSFLTSDNPYWSAILGIQQQAQDLADRLRDAFAAGSIGAQEFANKMLWVQQAAERMQYNTLLGGIQAIFLSLYEFLGRTKEAEAMKHAVAVAQLLAARAQLEAAVASATISEELRARLNQMLHDLDPLIEEAIRNPRFGIDATIAAQQSLAQSTAQADNALQQLKDAFLRAKDDIRSTLGEFARGGVGIVTPQEALRAAQAQWADIFARAQAGELTAYQGAPQAARNLIEVLKRFSPAFAAVELPRIMAQLESLLGVTTIRSGSVTYSERFVAQQEETNRVLNYGFDALEGMSNRQLSEQQTTNRRLDSLVASQTQITDWLTRQQSGDEGTKREPFAL